ncbi:piggyBac transposable element-derived protein 3-like isoform X1 [Wyeomyia smithii]|uniref:piggyBac transposable element-derived protein 3-like isoform X1 n=1 Tax=Wyeomyia smithii TaxID=174621 RepID=UPI002467D32A|nr:piggyBac transposable element-derived protein 3-like isoform X1 [Wyeomyia smithii]
MEEPASMMETEDATIKVEEISIFDVLDTEPVSTSANNDGHFVEPTAMTTALPEDPSVVKPTTSIVKSETPTSETAMADGKIAGSSSRNLTLREALDYLDELNLEDDDYPAHVYIQPPENDGNVSGEDGVDDDEMSDVSDNVCAGQLTSGCEIVLNNGNRIDGLTRSEESLKMTDSPVDTQPPLLAPTIDLSGNSVWKTDDSFPLHTSFPEPSYEDCVNLRPHELFEKFFDLDVINHICECSNLYAVYHNRKLENAITVDELRVVIGILLVAGYTGTTSFENMWSAEDDMRNLLVFNSMRRNRFNAIIQNLHFEKSFYTPVTVTDKFWRLRPLINMLNTNMLKNFHAEQNLSYDESMIPYFAKQRFIHGKSLRFGYKAYALCTPSGYLVNFELYQEKSPRTNDMYERCFGKCAAPLFYMIDDLHPEMRDLPFSFYFGNLFTGFPLLMYLKDHGYNATGTIRENRILKNCSIPSKEHLRKKARGHIECGRLDGTDIRLTKWVDNSVVCIASTVYGKMPVSSAKRYSREAGKRILIDRPCVVTEYNKNVCGVDRMDQNVAHLRISYRGKKWWFPIFAWLIDVCVQNAWQLHRRVNPTTTQLQFRRELAVWYCKHYGRMPKAPGVSALHIITKKHNKLKDNVRFDRTDHFPKSTESRRRCAGDTCKSQTRMECKKCNVGLCLSCFEAFHTVS